MFNRLLLIAALLFHSINASDDFENGKKFHRAKAESPIYLEIGDVTVTLKDFYFASSRQIPGIETMVRRGFKIKTIKGDIDVGYAVVGPILSTRLLAVNWFAIGKDYRRQGYAEQAIKTIEGIAKANQEKWPGTDLIYYDVSKENTAMSSLLEKLGYDKQDKGTAFHFTKQIPKK